MHYIQGFDRDQLVMMDFESAAGSDSWVRIVDMFVGILPMGELGFKDVLNSEGRPPYRSGDMLKLYLYGYKNKLRSSRQLEHACKVNLEVIWLLKGLRPSAGKIAYFRKQNPNAFKAAFRYFVVLLKDWELIEGVTYTLMKGKQNVLSEVNLIMICYNLTRIMAILDPKELKNRLKMLALKLLPIFELISGILSHFFFPASLSCHKRNGHKRFARIL